MNERIRKLLPAILGVCVLLWLGMKLFVAPDFPPPGSVPEEQFLSGIQDGNDDEYVSTLDQRQPSPTPSASPSEAAEVLVWEERPAEKPRLRNLIRVEEPVGETKLFGEKAKTLRDPFRKLVQVEGSEKATKTPLESHPTSSFQVVGIVKSQKNTSAMVMAPDSKTYFLKKGVRIGTRGGVVEEITSDSVVIREFITNPLGEEDSVFFPLSLNPSNQDN